MTAVKGASAAPERDFRPRFNSHPALEELGKSFKAAMVAVRRLRGRETHRVGELSYAQYGLMFALADCGSRSTREIATAADLSSATVTQMLDSLENAGLVERARSPEDRRVVLTSLTDRGRALVDARRSEFEERWRTATEGFSDEELETAAAILDRLASLFDELAQYRDTDPAR
jgi:DNA-binding MarR family transcriptional regulator